MVVLVPLPLVIMANVAVGRTWAHLAIGILAGTSAGLTFLIGALDLAGAGTTTAGANSQGQIDIDAGYMVTAALAAALASKPVRERVSRILPVDPDNPVHSLALVLAVLLFGTQLTAILFTNLGATVQTPLGVGDLISQEVPFVILAAAGVGIFIRRNAGATAARLGLVVPLWWQVVMAIAAAGLFFAFGQGMAWLAQALTPDVARQVNATTQQLYSGLGGPVGIATVALAPGICEEIMFRGALQPRLGLIVTALLFASIHTQYGLSLDALTVFLIALGLGVVRRFTNTTTSMICHAGYNLMVGVAGLGLADSVFGAGAAVELVLVAVATYAIWSRPRRESAVPDHP